MHYAVIVTFVAIIIVVCIVVYVDSVKRTEAIFEIERLTEEREQLKLVEAAEDRRAEEGRRIVEAKRKENDVREKGEDSVRPDYGLYEAACRRYAQRLGSFRRDPHVTYMMEHVPPEQAQAFLTRTQELMGSLPLPWATMLTNDDVGDPYMGHYTYNGTDVRVCPTTTRYIAFACLMMQTLRGQTVDLIEIGGGYGGQCAMLYKLAPTFSVHIRSYVIFDLEDVSRLQHKYLSMQPGVPLQDIGLRRIDTPGALAEGSFLFSAYAYSEISEDAQNAYHQPLKGLISHGFIVWNNARLPSHGFYEMIGRSRASLKIEPELPLTSPFNYFYSW